MPETGAPIPVQTQARIAGGEIVIAAPRGFCVDPKTLRDAPGASFVLFGHCPAMARDPAQPRPSAPVLLSVTLGPEDNLSDSARIKTIAAFFETDIGRATLARSGRTEDVDLIEARSGQGRLLLKIRDRSAPASVAEAQVFWRMITVIEGRIASLSVMPLAENQVSDARQRELLVEFISQIRAVN
ncbi:hypothetical protein CLN94_07940 [Pseudothioclava arenosa]|uniref:DUF1795 domain-containing protein n=1 Tax=Pseudothioclava arenosa TaxID=1795308 RepID=A0A2A4CPI2_9RHOB|nr:hypothetical protein CLN94_07940 [Pseudothioclava arenosa]